MSDSVALNEGWVKKLLAIILSGKNQFLLVRVDLHVSKKRTRTSSSRYVNVDAHNEQMRGAAKTHPLNQADYPACG